MHCRSEVHDFDVQMRIQMCTSQSGKLAPRYVDTCISVHTPFILFAAEWTASAICLVSQLRRCQTSASTEQFVPQHSIHLAGTECGPRWHCCNSRRGL